MLEALARHLLAARTMHFSSDLDISSIPGLCLFIEDTANGNKWLCELCKWNWKIKCKLNLQIKPAFEGYQMEYPHVSFQSIEQLCSYVSLGPYTTLGHPHRSLLLPHFLIMLWGLHFAAWLLPTKSPCVSVALYYPRVSHSSHPCSTFSLFPRKSKTAYQDLKIEGEILTCFK